MTIVEPAAANSEPKSKLVDGITQDLIKFHKEQWRFYETQRQWLLIAVVTFSSVLTASFFSSGAKDALNQLNVTTRNFVMFLVFVDIAFCVLAAIADCKFVVLANSHERKAKALIEGAIKLQPDGGPQDFNTQLLTAANSPSRGTSDTAAAYATALAVNLTILDVFAFGGGLDNAYYIFVGIVFLGAAAALIAFRNVAGSETVMVPGEAQVDHKAGTG